MKKIGIIGCGTIGSFLAKKICSELRDKARLIGLYDIDPKKARALAERLSLRTPIIGLEALIRKSDLLIEASSARASADICRKAVEDSKDVMIMSVGGLIGKREIFKLAEKKSATIILPSGAICGLDGLKSAMSGKVKKVTLTTRKPPQGLKGAPYIVKNNIDLDAITKEEVIFEGSAKDAVLGFPANVNVSAVLSLAGLGAKKTRVRMVTSPEYMVNTHEIEVEGDFGRLIARTENVPFPENPKTSYLAALSALSTLKQYLDRSLSIGS